MNDAAEIPISEMGGGGLQRCVYYKPSAVLSVSGHALFVRRGPHRRTKHVLIHTRRDGFFRSILT